MKQSAGILLFKKEKDNFLFFLVHPGGPFWKNKDAGAWSVPKGEFTEEEDAFEAAIREFKEETGIAITAKKNAFISLSPVKLKSGKKIVAWALEQDADADKIVSNTFEMEWPPRSGKIISVPEIDKAGWFPMETALEKINEAQRSFLLQIQNSELRII